MKSIHAVALLAAMTLGLAAAAHAQGSLTDSVALRQKVIVTDRSGTQSEGRVTRVSPSELVLIIDGREQVIPSTDIRRIERGDAPWNGAMFGAAPFALLGAAAAGASCSPRCSQDVPRAMLVFGAIGAAVGGLIDSRIHGYAILGGPSLASPNVRSSPVPVTTIDELWQRVRSGDRISVETRSGQTVAGRFAGISSGFVTLTIDGERRDIPSSDVWQVVRAGNRHRSGALWGAGIAATISIAASASCGGNGCGNPLFAAAMGGSVGALWGSLIGAMIPQHRVIFGVPAASSTRVMPVLGPGRVGAAFSKTF